MTEEEARVVYEMTLRNELSGGIPVVREFEAEWRQFTGLDYAITTCNGTGALYSAYFGLGVGPGDEVICPTYTWICTASPVPLLGALPVLCESDPKTMLIDAEDIRRRITPRTKAIVVVHLWGWVCDMDAIMEISRETGVPVIEDCSHAHGATYKGCGNYPGYKKGDFPVTEAMHQRLLFLPILSDPMEGAVEYFLDALKQAGTRLKASVACS